MERILKIDEKNSFDESIERYEFHGFDPISGITNDTEIQIPINKTSAFTHPSKSYLQIEGRLLKADGTSYADDDLVTLINNGMMYLFKYITYALSGVVIEHVNNPGHASTMFGFLTYADDLSRMNQLWVKDESTPEANEDNKGFDIRHKHIIEYSNPKGTFQFRIPFKHIFGFADDYNKVIYGFDQALTLSRGSDNDAIFKAGAVAVGKIELLKIRWFMPHVIPNDEEKMRLYKLIEQKKSFEVGFRRRQCDKRVVAESTSFDWRMAVKLAPEKPRWIVVGFQTDKQNNQIRNPAVFDHCNIKSIHIELNETNYPQAPYNLNFTQQKYDSAYSDAHDFRLKFYGLDEEVNNSIFPYYEFKTLYPLFVFDVSNQSEIMAIGAVDINIKAIFYENPPANTMAYALVISDKILSLKSDGNQMTVLQN